MENWSENGFSLGKTKKNKEGYLNNIYENFWRKNHTWIKIPCVCVSHSNKRIENEDV
jgi:hypothetical protein